MNKKKYYLYEMNINTLNIVSLLIFILTMFLVVLVDKNFIKISIDYLYTGTNFIIFLILYVFYMILHEILHSVAYVVCGAKYDKVTYGAAIEKGVLYCLCKQNITKKNILVSLMTPFTLIGIITLIVAFIIKSPFLLFLSIFNISGCAGDIIMFAFITKLKDIEFSEFDDPIAFGLYSQEELPKKVFGLKYIGSSDKLKREDYTKINISKTSKIAFIILVILLITLTIMNNL